MTAKDFFFGISIISYTAKNMPECGFSLTGIFVYKDRIVDSVLIWESTGRRKLLLCIFYAVLSEHIKQNYLGILLLN